MKATFRVWAKFTVVLVGCGFALISIWRTQAQELRQVSDPPLFGTFWLLSFELDGRQSPPYPFDPYEGSLPIYQLEGFPGNYLVADSPEDYSELRNRKTAEAYGEMSTMDGDEGPPVPGEGGGGEGGGGPEFDGPEYGTNDLWLEIVTVTNGLANFTIHTPDSAAYDLFGTTNLATDVPGLNGTYWVWLLRTEVGETNIVLTNLWPDMGFFRLGTMQDSDNDGLTDAYERLVSHTDPLNWDTDGDGLSDGWEVEHGMNPLLNESAQSSSRLNYQYDGSGWLRVVSGSWSEGITLDNEGNVLTAQ